MYQRILLPTDGAEFIHSETIKLADEKLATIKRLAQAAGRFPDKHGNPPSDRRLFAIASSTQLAHG